MKSLVLCLVFVSSLINVSFGQGKGATTAEVNAAKADLTAKQAALNVAASQFETAHLYAINLLDADIVFWQGIVNGDPSWVAGPGFVAQFQALRDNLHNEYLDVTGDVYTPTNTFVNEFIVDVNSKVLITSYSSSIANCNWFDSVELEAVAALGVTGGTGIQRLAVCVNCNNAGVRVVAVTDAFESYINSVDYNCNNPFMGICPRSAIQAEANDSWTAWNN